MEFIYEDSLTKKNDLVHGYDVQAQQIISYTNAILEQLQSFVGQFLLKDAPDYTGPVGSHIRHIIEHYEALVYGVETIDYDARPRDMLLETNALESSKRIATLMNKINPEFVEQLYQKIQVQGLVGLFGDQVIALESSIARELIFLASHTIHHCAILLSYCKEHGIIVDPHFGVAPSTVAYQLASQKNKS